MHATLSGAVQETRRPSETSTTTSTESLMPSTNSFNDDLNQHAQFREEDPSNHYDITSKYKLGSGGFAKVFRVVRKSDQKVLALKFI